MEDKFFAKIKEFEKVVPSANWKASQKEVLMTQIRAQVKNRKSQNAYGAVLMQAIKNIFELRSFSLLFKRSSVAFMAIVVFLTGGAYGVHASEESLPGDLLYTVKRSKEKMRIKLSSSDEKKTELHIEFAGKRLQEFAVLKEQDIDSDKKVEKMTVAVVDFKESIDEVREGLSKAEYTIKETAKIIEVAVLVDDKIEEFTDYLDENIKSDKTDELTYNNHLGILDTVEDAIKVGKQASVDAVTLMVKQSAKEGVEEETKEDIKLKVLRKIEVAQDDVNEYAEEIIEDITKKEDLEPVKEDVVEEASEDEKNPQEVTEEATDEAGEQNIEEEPLEALDAGVQVDELPEVVLEEVKKIIEEEPKKAGTLLTEAEQLADDGDLTEALEKLQATQSLVDETKVKVDDIIEKAIEEAEEEIAEPAEEKEEVKSGELVEEEAGETSEATADDVEESEIKQEANIETKEVTKESL